MSKVVLDDVISGYGLSKINENFQKIEDELNNKVLYRNNPVDEINTMEQNLDLNGFSLYNVEEINGVAVDTFTANVDVVASSIASINTVATNIDNVNIVAGIDDDVTNVAAVANDVTILAPYASDVGAYATGIYNNLASEDEGKGASLVSYRDGIDVKDALDMERIFAAQQDYVNYVASRISPSKMRLSRVTSPYDCIRVSYISGTEHYSHEIKKNTNDDWYMYFVGFAGDTGITNINSTNGTFTGTWSATTEASNNTYTTVVGDYYEFTVTGDTIEAHFFCDNRGGIFEAMVDGDTGNKVIYSTYGTLNANSSKIIFTGLTNTTHTVRCTFNGADPANPPSGGTARGWACNSYTAGTNRLRYTGSGGIAFGEGYNIGNNKIALGYGSNKEFAMNVIHGGATNWFPEHNSIGTAVKTIEPYVLIDGKQVLLANLVVDKVYEGSRIEFVQSAKCRFPATSVDIISVDCSFIFQADGVVSIDGKMQFLEPCTIENGYAMMFPLWGSNVKEFVTGIGNRQISAGDESNSYFATEKDRVFSVAGVDSRNPSLIAAMTIDNPIQTLRYGETGRQDDPQFVLLWNRATTPKLYFHTFKNATMAAGDIYKFSGRYVIGKFNNAYAAAP